MKKITALLLALMMLVGVLAGCGRPKDTGKAGKLKVVTTIFPAYDWVREILGDKAIIGISAHNVAEAVAAEKAGATYLGCGAVFHTSTKHDATLLPYAVLCDIRKAVCIPVVAIGGITAHNIPQLYSSGIDGVAVVSAVFGQPDVTRAARELHELTNPFQKKEQRL